ncbi:hypothetical protein C4K16_4022 [Pseudomonas chlororaphis subsp. aurantiaca]|nr:hypothetical protein C4K16_4022 [Pseudomonas chlororaphis subsp. aurantiaca]
MIKAASLPASGALSRASRIAARSLCRSEACPRWRRNRRPHPQPKTATCQTTAIKKPPGFCAESRWP